MSITQPIFNKPEYPLFSIKNGKAELFIFENVITVHSNSGDIYTFQISRKRKAQLYRLFGKITKRIFSEVVE